MRSTTNKPRRKLSGLTALPLVLALLPAVGSAQEEEDRRERRVIRVPDRQVMVFEGNNGDVVEIEPFGFWRGAFLGVDSIELSDELRAHFGVPEGQGVMLSTISEDTPAAAAGLRVGDILTSVDGETVESRWELARMIRQHEDGDAVNLEIWRDGRVQTITATLAQRERPQFDVGRFLHTIPEEGAYWSFGPDGEVKIDTGWVDEMVDELSHKFEGDEWQERFDSMRSRREHLGTRMEELEKRLRELESELERLAEEDEL